MLEVRPRLVVQALVLSPSMHGVSSTVLNCAQFIIGSHTDVILFALFDMCVTCDMTSCFVPIGFCGCLVHPLITHSIIFKSCSLAHRCSCHPHMLVVLARHHVLSPLCSVGVWYTHYSPTALFSKRVHFVIDVSITTQVGGFWHMGHDIMFCPCSVF